MYLFEENDKKNELKIKLNIWIKTRKSEQLFSIQVGFYIFVSTYF